MKIPVICYVMFCSALFILLALSVTACGGKDEWSRVACTDAQDLTDVIGDDYILPEIPEGVLEDWDLQIFYLAPRMVRFTHKHLLAHGYEYELMPVNKSHPFVRISLRACVDEYEYRPVGFAFLSEETLSVDNNDIEYLEYTFGYQDEPADKEIACIYASYLRYDGVRYVVELWRSLSPIELPSCKSDYRVEIEEYFHSLFERGV